MKSTATLLGMSLFCAMVPFANGATPTEVNHANSAYFPQPVYVALQGKGAVEELPSGKIWEGFPLAHYIDYSTRGNFLLISGFATGNVYLASAQNGHKIATFSLGGVIQGVKLDPAGTFGLAVDASQGSVYVLNVDTHKVLKKIEVGKIPHNIIFSRNGDIAYVTIQGEDKIAVIDMKSLKVVRDIHVNDMKTPHNLDLTASGQRLWIRSHSMPDRNGTVVLLDLKSGKTLAHFRVGHFHGGMDVIPGNRYAATTNIGGNTAEVFTIANPHLVKQLDVGEGPHGVRGSKNGKWIYTAATRSAEFDVISTRSLNIVEKISLPKGSFPFWMAVPGNP